MVWQAVKWSEPGQVLALLGLDPGLASEQTVQGYYQGLIRQDLHSQAADYVAQALPRWEAVTWAARTVTRLALSDAQAPGATLRAVLQWIRDPGETRRRAAFAAAQSIEATTPEYLLAMAAFYSGGSVAPEGCEPIQPPRDAAGRFCAGAVKLAVARSADLPKAYQVSFSLLDTLLELDAREQDA